MKIYHPISDHFELFRCNYEICLHRYVRVIQMPKLNRIDSSTIVYMCKILQKCNPRPENLPKATFKVGNIARINAPNLKYVLL